MSASATSGASAIVERISIPDLWRALGGGELRRTGPEAYRGRAFWRDGDGFSVALDGRRKCWHDFRDNVGGGVLALVSQVRDCAAREALAWLADYAGIPLDDRAVSAADRRQWAEERRAIDRDLPDARYWRRGAAEMAEESLAALKAALFAPDEPQPDTSEIHRLTVLLANWQRMGDSELVREYGGWKRRAPGMTWALVEAARQREKLEALSLCRYLDISSSFADRALSQRVEARA